MVIRSIREAKIKKGTRVILRADFDVAIEKGKIIEPFRIREALPTLRYLIKRKARIRIISHLGRPHGKVVPALSMRGVAKYLGRLLKKNIVFVKNPLYEPVFQKYNQSEDILFFENIRFWPEEENNNMSFGGQLAKWGDIYINEAFANSHRDHVSMSALPGFLLAFAGIGLEKEIFYLDKSIKNPQRPFVAVLGGAKLETKIPLIKKFLEMGDAVLIGGVIANTIFLAKGYDLGISLVEKEWVNFFEKTRVAESKLYLPLDLRAARSPKDDVHIRTTGSILKNEAAFDIGPRTSKLFNSVIGRARTIIWNGPLGLAEVAKFSHGTRDMAQSIARQKKAFSVLGGGDTIAVLRKYKLLKGFGHISTGGGAMLEFLAGKKLPGIEVLKRRKR